MSHFTVTVALAADVTDVNAALEAALAPFDENAEVEEVEEGGETYWHNPNAKWDWWTIGGRWRGRFLIQEDADVGDLIDGESSWTNDGEPHDPAKCDGGRIRALDLEGARRVAAEKAEVDWDEYAMAIYRTPQHRPWSEFLERVEAARASQPWEPLHEAAVARALSKLGLASKDELDAVPADQLEVAIAVMEAEVDVARADYRSGMDYDINRARVDYAAQPRIAALRKYDKGADRWEMIRYGADQPMTLSRREKILAEVAALGRLVPGTCHDADDYVTQAMKTAKTSVLDENEDSVYSRDNLLRAAAILLAGVEFMDGAA